MRNLCIDLGSTFVKFWILDEKSIVLKNQVNFPEPSIADGVVYEVDLSKIDSIIFEIF